MHKSCWPYILYWLLIFNVAYANPLDDVKKSYQDLKQSVTDTKQTYEDTKQIIQETKQEISETKSWLKELGKRLLAVGMRCGCVVALGTFVMMLSPPGDFRKIVKWSVIFICLLYISQG